MNIRFSIDEETYQQQSVLKTQTIRVKDKTIKKKESYLRTKTKNKSKIKSLILRKKIKKNKLRKDRWIIKTNKTHS